MLKKINALSIVFATMLALSAVSCTGGKESSGTPQPVSKTYSRIISLAPNITETLFALGLGDRVAGVTDFCKYPPEARTRAKVGGLFNPNLEAMAVLKPDLVILLPESEQVRAALSGQGVEILTVRNRVVAEILDSITAIGKKCGAEGKATALRTDIETRMASVREKTVGLNRPRVLLVVERTLGTGNPGAVCVAGPNTFYDELITLAGGKNAYRGPAIPYPQVSGESILRLDPEIIIDLLPVMTDRGLTEDAVRRDWNCLPGVSAVKTGRLHVMSADYTVIPGPRFIRTLEDLAALMHPEMKAEP